MAELRRYLALLTHTVYTNRAGHDLASKRMDDSFVGLTGVPKSLFHDTAEGARVAGQSAAGGEPTSRAGPSC